MIKLGKRELPVTYSLMNEERKKRNQAEALHPFISYFYYWAGFNEIYANIAYIKDYAREYERDPVTDQIIKKADGSVQIPKVKHVQEREQIRYAVEEFDDDLKRNLILHKGTKFFYNRIPSWEGRRIEFDNDRQRVNGVIKTSQMREIEYPVWSPIDIVAYPHYLTHQDDSAARDLLTKQIIALLYTIRCNLVHGNKPGDDNDMKVVAHALPLLKTVVAGFTY